MSTTAAQIRSKINRAQENVQEFRLRASAFYEANPHIVASREHPERGQRIWYVARLPATPDALASVAADAIGNLRKPLDYLATQIESAACGGAPKRGVYFPTGGSAVTYDANRHANLRCAGKEATDIVDAAEPYKGGKGEALWQLHELNRSDKHRLPLALSGGYRALDVGPVMRDGWRRSFPGNPAVGLIPSLFVEPADPMCPLEEGDELFAEPLENHVYEDRRFLLEVSFHEPGVIECEAVLETLQRFAVAVSGIVTAVEPLLP